LAADERDIQIQITLHYIDKLFAAIQRLAEAAHRFLLIGIALSVVVLAISGGVASTDRQ